MSLNAIETNPIRNIHKKQWWQTFKSKLKDLKKLKTFYARFESRNNLKQTLSNDGVKIYATFGPITYVTFCSTSISNSLSWGLLKKYQPWPLFHVLVCFSKNMLHDKIVDFSGIWTRIVGVEGEHADH